MSELLLPPPVAEGLPRERLLGLTTTVPVEVILAAGLVPVDLNNLFITAEEPAALAEAAEHAGFPRTCCCWTRGIYGAVKAFDVPRLLIATRGDCSNAEALMEVLVHEGVRCETFDYPARAEADAMRQCLATMAEALGTTVREAQEWRERLAPARRAAAEIDRLSHEEDRVHGLENHLWLVSTSDFCTDPAGYGRAAERFCEEAAAREPIPHGLRLGVCGIPPIIPGIFGFLESLGALVVFNETPRQFAMPFFDAASLAEQYTCYTYPYGVFARLEDLRAECERRRLDGMVHYVQSFCHRRIHDRIVRDGLEVPVLSIEADRPGPLSGQLKTRLEAFVQMLTARKAGMNLL